MAAYKDSIEKLIILHVICCGVSQQQHEQCNCRTSPLTRFSTSVAIPAASTWDISKIHTPLISIFAMYSHDWSQAHRRLLLLCFLVAQVVFLIIKLAWHYAAWALEGNSTAAIVMTASPHKVLRNFTKHLAPTGDEPSP
jgi:hypothetical protein